MAEVFRLDQGLADQLIHADRVNNPHMLNAMNAAADAVIANGGMCDEAALVASFFGNVVTGDRPDYEELSMKICGTLPESRREQYRAVDNLRYLENEPYIMDTNANFVGMLVMANCDNGQRSVLDYDIVEDLGAYVGTASCNYILQSRDPSTGVLNPPECGKSAVIRMRRLREKVDTGTVAFDTFERMKFGMPNIRRAFATDTYLDPGSIDLVEESVAHLREFVRSEVST